MRDNAYETSAKRIKRLHLKKDSPSCGMERVKVWHETGKY